MIRTQCFTRRSSQNRDWANGFAGMLHGDCFEAGGLFQTQSSAKVLSGLIGRCRMPQMDVWSRWSSTPIENKKKALRMTVGISRFVG